MLYSGLHAFIIGKNNPGFNDQTNRHHGIFARHSCLSPFHSTAIVSINLINIVYQIIGQFCPPSGIRETALQILFYRKNIKASADNLSYFCEHKKSNTTNRQC